MGIDGHDVGMVNFAESGDFLLKGAQNPSLIAISLRKIFMAQRRFSRWS